MEKIKHEKQSDENSTQYKGGQGMESLIPIINKLQDVFSTVGISPQINLPQIVVVGTQSAGKSSVLESLVGKSFLPRGSGIVTRCPIILKLIHTDDEREWCEFSHQKGEQYTDFTEVEQEVINQTTVLAGGRRGITKDPIQITVHSQNVITLTVVDLPGIVQIAADDQPEDIGDQIKELIMDYISQRNTIILAISSANNDIVTSESIKLAKEVDGNGERTLAILTKVDLGEISTTEKALTGKVVTVKLGIIGVINRSQEDIDSKKSIQDALIAEQKYLKSKYSGIASKHGTPYLANRLNQILMKHISNCFPALEINIKKLASDYKAKLNDLGSGPMNAQQKRAKMVGILRKFSMAYIAQLEGSGLHLNTKDLCSVAKINLIFQKEFDCDLSALNPLTDLDDNAIVTALKNSCGLKARLFNPEPIFQALVKPQIEKMRTPVLRCADLVYKEMEKTVGICLDSALHRFPKMNRSIAHVVNELLRQRIEVSKNTLNTYIDIQISFPITSELNFYTEMEKLINKVRGPDNQSIDRVPVKVIPTNSQKIREIPIEEFDKLGSEIYQMCYPVGNVPLGQNFPTPTDFPTTKKKSVVSNLSSKTPSGFFISGCGKFPTPVDKTLSNAQETENVHVVKEMVGGFFKIIRKQVQDYVPRCLLHELIDYVLYNEQHNIHNELICKLDTPENIERLLQESVEITERREIVSQDLKALEEAIKILDEVKESVECGKFI